MSVQSSIEWTDATWNPTRGCTKIAQGCKNCYAETFAERFRDVTGHPYEQGFDPRTAPDKLTEPLKWKKPRRVFVDSMSDLFHEAFSFEYIAACYGVMNATRRHTYQLLTKRPERAAAFYRWLTQQAPQALSEWVARVTAAEEMSGDPIGSRGAGSHSGEAIHCHNTARDMIGYGRGRMPAGMHIDWPLPNVWIGTSIAEQKDADKNIPHLLQIPAAVRFLSVEPLIAPVNIRGAVGNLEPRIHWCIVGGESGPKARPCNVEWIRSVVAQCKAADVPVFVKQLGAKPIDSRRGTIYCANEPHAAKCNAVILRDRKGGDIAEFPADIRIRQFPEPR